MAKEPRPGSRKHSVFRMFHEQGYDAALEYGHKLGLKEGTVRSWARTWEKEAAPPPPPVPKKAAKKPPSPPGPLPPERAKGSASARVRMKRKGPRGVRVYDLGSPGRIGTVLQDGPEVSEVQWDDGKKQYVTNDYLREVETGE